MLKECGNRTALKTKLNKATLDLYETVKCKRFTRAYGEKGWTMGVIQDHRGLAEPADV